MLHSLQEIWAMMLIKRATTSL